MARKHFVEFLSPGTFVSETQTHEIGEWDPRAATAIAATIAERYGARPYGFRFSTVLTVDPVPDGEGGTLTVQPKKIATSGMHYIKGTVRYYEAMPDDHDTRILRDNMRCNGWPIVVETANGFRWTAPYEKGDRIVDADGTIVDTGDDPKHVEYRARQVAAWAAAVTA